MSDPKWRGRIVGLDLSIRNTGISIRTQEHHTSVTMAVGKVSPENPYYLAHAQFAVDLCKRLQENDLAVIELPVVGHKSAVNALYSLASMVRLGVYRKTGLLPIDVHPMTLKRFATGTGNAKKEMVLMEVYKRWGMSFATNDEADAFVCAVIGTMIVNGAEPSNEAQRKSLAKVREMNPHLQEQVKKFLR